jgi:hypothetical protein
LDFKYPLIKRNNYLFPEKDDDNPERQLSGSFTIGSGDEEEFQNEFGWYSMVYTYAKENSISLKEAYNDSALEFLTFMNFWVRKGELERNRLNKINNANRNNR